ncbi:MAG: hypothetical protein M3315_01150 [Actinomycetota bacterium]|nr:hypothetical protein [Actinomycetota bacterium]
MSTVTEYPAVAKYRVGPKDFPAKRHMRAYRVTFPAGHCLNHEGNGDMPLVRFFLKPYEPAEEGLEPLDDKVVSEVVLISHTELLNGGPGRPTLVGATPGLILKELNFGSDVEEL